MIAVDTNIVVRFLVDDDLRQSEQAVYLFRRETVFLARSVLLETEWVLRRGYKMNPVKIGGALEALIGLPNVVCEDDSGVRQALMWHQAGMDFADALHLAAGSRAAQFITFDQDMIKAAKRLGLPVSAP